MIFGWNFEQTISQKLSYNLYSIHNALITDIMTNKLLILQKTIHWDSAQVI